MNAHVAGNNEFQIYSDSPSNIFVKDGALHLKVQSMSSPNFHPPSYVGLKPSFTWHVGYSAGLNRALSSSRHSSKDIWYCSLAPSERRSVVPSLHLFAAETVQVVVCLSVLVTMSACSHPRLACPRRCIAGQQTHAHLQLADSCFVYRD